MTSYYNPTRYFAPSIPSRSPVPSFPRTEEGFWDACHSGVWVEADSILSHLRNENPNFSPFRAENAERIKAIIQNCLSQTQPNIGVIKSLIRYGFNFFGGSDVLDFTVRQAQINSCIPNVCRALNITETILQNYLAKALLDNKCDIAGIYLIALETQNSNFKLSAALSEIQIRDIVLNALCTNNRNPIDFLSEHGCDVKVTLPPKATI